MPRYIISLPFKGTVKSATYTDVNGIELVSYSSNLCVDNKGDMTLEDYLLLYNLRHHPNDKLVVISEEELDKYLNAYYNSLKTKPKRISKAQYYEWLECLPPSRYQRLGKATVFHICERLTGNLVQWCIAMPDNKYYGFTDEASLSTDTLIAIITKLTKS